MQTIANNSDEFTHTSPTTNACEGSPLPRTADESGAKVAPKETVIQFQIDDPAFANGPSPYVSPYVHLTKEGFSKSLRHMRGKTEAVLHASPVVLVIDYPMTNVYRETLSSPTGTFTREQLCKAVAEAYQRIYDEERATTTLPVETVAARNPGCCLKLINRAATNGKWGIVNHVLGDLLLYDITYNPSTYELELGVDSWAALKWSSGAPKSRAHAPTL